MSTTLPVAPPVSPSVAPSAVDEGTRRRVLDLVASAGPVSAPELAERLDLTSVAVRRHLSLLEGAGQIVVHAGTAGGPSRRGRPARRWVATGAGQAALSQRYSELAAQALRFLARTGGPAAVEAFAEQRARDLEERLAPLVAGDALPERVAAVAAELTADGYGATVRPGPGGSAAVQLCQGHCPVQDVAREFPQLCEAEARGFSRLLGVHVQRLSTLASGGHVCTTNVPLTPRTPHGTTTGTTPARRTEGPHA
ncbi:helix-turn-helix transcriptional regulator [Cellulomonas endophytica]|uniref:helix-turn-helix transcriptional regulator n=1 Tax=Cellulomonas endophytica TaxID=2494735 RepID=UPI0010117F76|nr:helix-turn-helix domain-containing protein [Cellulomonas endophytica]